jgi:hypothetical protein
LKTSVVAALLGAAAVARAPADGYKILLGGTQTHVNETLLKSRPLCDPVKDLVPIAGAAVYFLGIAIYPAVPAQVSRSSSLMRRPIPASCPMGTPVSARSSI